MVDKQQIFKRSINLDDENIRSSSLEGVIEGRPIVTEKETIIAGYYREIIDRDALKEADLSDVMLLANHNDRMIPIARHRRGKRSSMDINVDGEGLTFTAKVDVQNNQTAAEICSAIERGDIDDMSFAFTIEEDEWTDLDKNMKDPAILPTRRIKKIGKVFEISAVNEGAYPQTSISARSSDSLENDKIALENAKSEALENEKIEAEKRQRQDAELKLAKEKFIYKEDRSRDN